MAKVNLYLAIEGVDGSGKSTVAGILTQRLSELGHTVTRVREPGGTTVGEAVRGLLLQSESLDVWAEVFLFAAQRAELARTVVTPALDRGDWVISDRSYYSSIAYQGRGRGLGMERIRQINETGLDGVQPHRVFVLDVDPAVALGRQMDPDRIGREGVEFQSSVRSAYLELAETEERVSLLDGELTAVEQVELIIGEVL